MNIWGFFKSHEGFLLNFLLLLLGMCMCWCIWCVYHDAHVEIRGQPLLLLSFWNRVSCFSAIVLMELALKLLDSPDSSGFASHCCRYMGITDVSIILWVLRNQTVADILANKCLELLSYVLSSWIIIFVFSYPLKTFLAHEAAQKLATGHSLLTSVLRNMV